LRCLTVRVWFDLVLLLGAAQAGTEPCGCATRRSSLLFQSTCFPCCVVCCQAHVSLTRLAVAQPRRTPLHRQDIDRPIFGGWRPPQSQPQATTQHRPVPPG
jgi:hypothetical protein